MPTDLPPLRPRNDMKDPRYSMPPLEIRFAPLFPREDVGRQSNGIQQLDQVALLSEISEKLSALPSILREIQALREAMVQQSALEDGRLAKAVDQLAEDLQSLPGFKVSTTNRVCILFSIYAMNANKERTKSTSHLPPALRHLSPWKVTGT